MPPTEPFTLTPYLEVFPGAPGAFVLDLGCGTGRHAQTLGRAGHRACALDLDLDALETARELHAVERPCVGRGEFLPFRDAAFDAVLCLDVLHWAADAAAFDAAWREAWRVLRAGGMFLGRLRVRVDASGTERSEDPWYRVEARSLETRAAAAGAAWIRPLRLEGDAAVFLIRKP